MMAELGMPVTSASVAAYYGDLLDGFVIDQKDAAYAQPLRDTGLAVLAVPTMMQTLEDRRTLARQVLDFSLSLSKRFDSSKARAV
jgi:LPPG:FO 2-phospho-L-lactate transferase